MERSRLEITVESDRGGLSLAAIVGIALAALVPLIATAVLLLWRFRYVQTSSLSEAPVRPPWDVLCGLPWPCIVGVCVCDASWKHLRCCLCPGMGSYQLVWAPVAATLLRERLAQGSSLGREGTSCIFALGRGEGRMTVV